MNEMHPLLDGLDDLARSGDPTFVPAFLDALRAQLDFAEIAGERDDRYYGWDGPGDLRAAAVDLLSQHRELAVAGLLEAVASTGDVDAAWFLGELGDERAVEPLAALAEGARAEFVRNVASVALREIAKVRVERLRDSGEVERLVEELRSDSGREPAMRAVSGCLEDASTHDAAAHALGALTDPNLVEFLLSQIGRYEFGAEQALAAARVLAELPDAGPTVPTLVGVLGSLGVEAPAELEAALERIGGPDAERAVAAHRRRYGSGEARRQVARMLRASRYGTPLTDEDWSLAERELQALGAEGVTMLDAIIEDEPFVPPPHPQRPRDVAQRLLARMDPAAVEQARTGHRERPPGQS